MDPRRRRITTCCSGRGLEAGKAAFDFLMTSSPTFAAIMRGRPIRYELIEDYGSGSVLTCSKVDDLITWAHGFPKAAGMTPLQLDERLPRSARSLSFVPRSAVVERAQLRRDSSGRLRHRGGSTPSFRRSPIAQESMGWSLPKGLIVHSRFDWLWAGCVLPLILANVACSSSPPAEADAGSASGQRIDPQGGTVTQNGATLVISAGALRSDTAFTITRNSAPPLSGVVSEGFVFAPDVTFATPVTITIPLEAAAPGAHLYWIPPTNGLIDLDGVVSGLSITGHVSRLGGLAFACIPSYGNSPNCEDSLSGDDD
jgi:hypothetical protein